MSRLDRRQVLRSGAVALGGAGVGWSGAAAARAPEGPAATGSADDVVRLSPPAGLETVPSTGPHQAGVATPPQAQLALLGLDLREGVDRDGLTRLLRLLGDDVERLTQGTGALGDTEPELAEHPARLTVTVGLGPRVLRELAVPGAAPRLDPLPSFSTDRLEDRWGQTDLAVQICADDPLAVAHARRMLQKDAKAFTTTTWVQEGFRYARGTVAAGATMRNVMGQVDGTVNPTEADADFADVVWADGPPAFAGGTFLVVRRIRTHLDTWDQVGREGRELTIGRAVDTGAPLTGTEEDDEPDFGATDASGLPVIDTAAHIRRARGEGPRKHHMLRRSFNYTEARPDGTDDAGLVFLAYVSDVGERFVPVQRRLAEQDRLNEWVTTIGSAVYAVPPGVEAGGAPGLALLGTT